MRPFRIDKKVVLIVCTVIVALIMILCVSLLSLPRTSSEASRGASSTPGFHLQIVVEKMTPTPEVFKLSTGKLLPSPTPKPKPKPKSKPPQAIVPKQINPTPTQTIQPQPLNPLPVAKPTPTPTPKPTPKPTPTPTPPTNLLTNPNFNTLSGWSCTSASAANSTLTIAYTSNKSGLCTETITLKANHTYKFQANVSGDHPTIVVGNVYYWLSGDLNGSYQNLSATFSTGSTTSWTVAISGTNSQGGAVYAQDASLTLVS